MQRALGCLLTLVLLGGGGLSAMGSEDPPPLMDDSLGAQEALLESPAGAPSPSFEDQLYQIINERRADCAGAACACTPNRPPMKQTRILQLSSDLHSENMAVRNFFMHCDPDTGSSPSSRAQGFGWPTIASVSENIAAGYSDPAAVMVGWMGSGGHCASIVGGQREVGAGYYLQSGDTGNVRQSATGGCPPTTSNNGPWSRYWTLNFSSRSTFFPLVIERELYATSSLIVDLYLYDGGGSSRQMRFSDDGEIWSPFTPYLADSVWVLPPGDGVKVVYSEFSSSSGTKRACDRIWVDGSGTTSATIFRESFECGAESLGLWDEVAP